MSVVSGLLRLRPLTHALSCSSRSRLARCTTSVTLSAHARFASKKANKKRNYEEDDKRKKEKKPVLLIPRSQLTLENEADRVECANMDERMKGPVDYFRKECSLVEVRASGRVTPAVLDPVRVKMGNAVSRLHDLATIGVRDGSMLLVTLFDEQNMKAVEGAIYEAKLPGIVPQRLDVRTIKIPVARPTVETRNNLLAGAQRKAEEARVHIRKHLKTSVKKGCYEKHSIELEEFNKVAHKYIAEVDKILVDLKTAISK